MTHWRAVLPAGVMLDVRYEDVVEDLEGQAKRIVAHCGLEWDDACLAFHETKRTVRTISHAQVRQPIYRSSVWTSAAVAGEVAGAVGRAGCGERFCFGLKALYVLI